MARMGYLNITLPDSGDGDDRGEARWQRWVTMLLIVLTFAGEMLGDEGLTCRPEARFDLNDCERVCYGYVAEASLTTCKCQYTAPEGQ